MPITMAIVVIKMGLKRAWFAATNASYVLKPNSFLWLAKSTNMMAFLATRPINIMIPKMVKMLNVSFVSARNNNAAMNDNGIENKMMNGLEKLSYRRTITEYTNITAAINAIPNVPKPSS